MQPESSYLPPRVPLKPSWEVVKSVAKRSPSHGDPNKLIVFDLETTGLNCAKEEITQIAAGTVDRQQVFNAYILPKKVIPREVVEITGLEVKVQNGVRCMFSNDRRVETMTLQDGLDSFIKFLKTLAEGGKVTLVGHNCLRFDMAFLYEALIVTNLLEEFNSIVDAVVDTLYVLKDAMPGRKSYKQQDIFAEIFHEGYCAHNALEDVKALAKLVDGVKKSYIQAHTYTSSSVLARVEYNKNRRKLVYSLYHLVNSKVLDESTAKKMADAGVGFFHLDAAYLHGKEVTLLHLLSGGRERGPPRVTRDKQIIEKLCTYFKRRHEPPPQDSDLLADQLAGLKM